MKFSPSTKIKTFLLYATIPVLLAIPSTVSALNTFMIYTVQGSGTHFFRPIMAKLVGLPVKQLSGHHPGNKKKALTLYEQHPEWIYICLVRDPRDVQLSLLHKVKDYKGVGRKPTFINSIDRFPEWVELSTEERLWAMVSDRRNPMSRKYLDDFGAISAIMNKPNTYIVRFEDIIGDAGLDQMKSSSKFSKRFAIFWTSPTLKSLPP